MCMTRYVTELIASLTSLFYLDWIKYQNLWTAFGAFAFAPYFAIIILNIALTIHRLAYTAFPFTASSYLSKPVLQVTLVAILLFFLSILIAMNIGLLGIRWVDAHMTWAIMKSRNPAVLRLNIRSQIKALWRTKCVHVTQSGISRTNACIH
ncbi:hypothetical protein Aduo_014322 [Ancylostoma duodenale]